MSFWLLLYVFPQTSYPEGIKTCSEHVHVLLCVKLAAVPPGITSTQHRVSVYLYQGFRYVSFRVEHPQGNTHDMKTTEISLFKVLKNTSIKTRNITSVTIKVKFKPVP